MATGILGLTKMGNVMGEELVYAMNVSNEEGIMIDVPHILYHKIRYVPNKWRVKSILRDGLRPQVASEYKDLVPLHIRDKPIVWLAGKLNSYIDAPVFSVQVGCLNLRNLYHVVDEDLDWFVYQAHIPKRALTKILVKEATND